jgi:mandelamide amidase
VIDRCEASSDLNGILPRDWESLKRAAKDFDARGPGSGTLAGVPLVLKDNINTRELPTTAGTGALTSFVPKENAPVAQRLFDQGALLGAKGNMHELAFGITSNNAVTGAARNPYNPSMIPGGSSGGVAVAVAQRMMPAGIGTDTGASVRLPAALCGIVGFRPTVGRYPGAGIVPISHTRDTAGPMTRSVADAVLLDAAMANEKAASEPVPATGLRIGVPRSYFYENLDPQVAAIASRALDSLADAGVELVEADIPEVGELNAAVSFPVALYEFMQDLPVYLAENNTGLTMQDVLAGIGSPDVKGLFGSLMGEEAMPEAVYREAIDSVRPKLQTAYAEYFSGHNLDAVIFPTAPLPARPIGDDETVELNGEQVPTFPTFIRNTDPGSNAGIPGISLPYDLTEDGLPVGRELDGPSGADHRLLAAAQAVESVFSFVPKPAAPAAG